MLRYKTYNIKEDTKQLLEELRHKIKVNGRILSQDAFLKWLLKKVYISEEVGLLESFSSTLLKNEAELKLYPAIVLRNTQISFANELLTKLFNLGIKYEYFTNPDKILILFSGDYKAYEFKVIESNDSKH